MIDRLRRRSQRALLAVLAYGIALFWVNHIPKVSVPLSGAGGDKVAHFLAYALLAFLLAWTVYPERRGRALGYLALLLGATAYGAIDEWLQQYVPHRTADWRDWIADILGAGLGLSTHAVVAGPIGRLRAKLFPSDRSAAPPPPTTPP
ncbi:MAG: VanZ family protein [Planctomycetales bacterium]|nr:VanZ family protein [Planctomycetales bacterium]